MTFNDALLIVSVFWMFVGFLGFMHSMGKKLGGKQRHR